jgi:hypothetical protein
LYEKTVVHSSNGTVIELRKNPQEARITSMFHGQTIDFERDIRIGDFFTNLAAELIPASSRSPADTPCTDLSTSRVDKGEFSLSTVTCVRFVTAAAAMTRNCVAADAWPRSLD